MTTLREAAQDVVDALIKNPTRVSKEVHIASVVLREVLAQPEREWQGLTDEEIEQVKKETVEQFYFAVMNNGSAVRNINNVWRNLEAKLKEKNAC